MSVHMISTKQMQVHINISARFNELSDELKQDTAGCPIGDQMIQLLKTYAETFHCSRATAYQRIKHDELVAV